MMHSGIAEMRRQLRKLLKHQKISMVFLVLCANVFYNLITFIVHIILANQIGPAVFGIFSLAISTMMIVNLIADLGFNLTMIRFFNLYNDKPKQQNLLLSSLLILRFSVLFLLGALALPASMLLARFLDIDNSYIFLFFLSFLTGGILSLWVYLQNFFQAYRKFTKLAAYIALCAILRIFCYVTLYFVAGEMTNVTYVLASLYTVPISIAIIVGMLPIVKTLRDTGLPKLPSIIRTIRSALQYSKWVAISGVFNNLILRMIQFILAFRASKYELGILSAGFVFTITFSTLNMSMRTVFFPHITSLESIADMKKYFVRVRKLAPYYIGLVIIAVLCLAVIQVVFLGEEYRQALPVFIITSIALAVSIFLGMWSMMIHTLMRPEVDAIVNILRLVIACIAVYVLAPITGAIGGSIAYAIPLVFGEIFLVWFVRRLIRVRS